MGFQKGAGQGIGFCSGCLLMAIAIPALALGGVASWFDDLGKRLNPPATVVRTTPRPTVRVLPTPTPTAPSTPAPPAWRDDLCEAILVTAESGDGARLLEEALRSGTSWAELRAAGRRLKADGSAVTKAWLALDSRAAYRDLRFYGLGIGGDLLSLGSIVLYAVDHTNEADANGRRLSRQVKSLNANLRRSTDALEAFNLEHPLFCAP